MKVASFLAILLLTPPSTQALPEHHSTWGLSLLEDDPTAGDRKLQGPPVAPEIFFLAMTVRAQSVFHLFLATMTNPCLMSTHFHDAPFRLVQNPAINGAIAQYETPIAVRFTNYVAAIWWNCVAFYSEDFKDTLTKEAPAVPVLDTSLHTTGNRLSCMLQAVATYNSLSLPESIPQYMDIVNGNNPFGVTFPVDEALDPDVDACASDLDCLKELAESEEYSSAIMGHIVGKLAYDYSIEDGFNQLGTDDGCQVSCRAFKDVTGYQPVNSPYNNDGRDQFWEPLLEDNGKGFFYRQEHVAAHIGQTAKFRFLPEEERTTRRAERPKYSRRRVDESGKVLELMAELDDIKKMEVESFDDKLVLAGAVVNSFLGAVIALEFEDPVFENAPGTYLTLERLVNYISGFAAMELDTTIMAWKEKVNYDLVRPTSIIKRFRGEVTTWAPGGVQTFPAENFEAYKVSSNTSMLLSPSLRHVFMY